MNKAKIKSSKIRNKKFISYWSSFFRSMNSHDKSINKSFKLLFIFLLIGNIFSFCQKKQKHQDKSSGISHEDHPCYGLKEVYEIADEEIEYADGTKIKKENISILLNTANRLSQDTNTYRNAILPTNPLVKKKLKVKDIKNGLANIEKVMLFGFGDSVSCSNSYGNGGIVGDNGYFTLLANSIKNLHNAKTIATDTSIIQQHLKMLKSITKIFPKDTFAIITFTTIGNNFLHPFGVAGSRGISKRYNKLPGDLTPNEAELYGVSVKNAKKLYGPLFRNYLELIYRELKRIFPGGFHLFIANVYDPTDGTGKLEEVRIGGKDHRLPPWKNALYLLNYFNKFVTGDFVDSHQNISLIDSQEVLNGFGNSKYGTPEYCYIDEIFEDPNLLGSKKIKDEHLRVMKNDLPHEIKIILNM